MYDLLLSFILPTYNSAEYLADTMDSLVASIGDYNHLVEIICVDDGSWDNTVTILEGYKSIYDNLIIIRNEHGGVSQARNTALDIVSGKYISFVDSDDLYEKDFLNTFISLDKNFDFLFTDVGGLKDEISFQEINEKEKLKIFKNNFNLGEYTIHPGIAGKFFRTSLINDIQLRFNTQLSFAEDILFNFTLLTASRHVILSPVNFYHVNGTHSLMYYNEKNLKGQIVFVDRIRQILKGYSESSEIVLIENFIILKAMTVYIDRYFGPLWLNGTYSLNEASKLMKSTIEDNDFSKAFNSNRLDYSIGNRYVVFRKLLRFRQYKLCLLYNRIMDKIKGYERFRKQ